MLNLRPHHLLCLLAFTGNGYSRGFVENMMAIQARFLGGESFEIILEGADTICTPCPHNDSDGTCLNPYGISVAELDKRVKTLLLSGEKIPETLLDLSILLLETGKPALQTVCKGCLFLDEFDCPTTVMSRLSVRALA